MANSLVSFYIVVFAPGCLSQSTPEAKQPIVVLCNGDDGLTLRLRDASERAFNETTDLPLASRHRDAVYKVMIPTNVDWRQIGSRTKVLYTIEVLTMNDKKIGTFKGSCWDAKIGDCGTQIVDSTRRVLAKGKAG